MVLFQLEQLVEEAHDVDFVGVADGMEGVEDGAEGRLLGDAAPAVTVLPDAPEEDPHGGQPLLHRLGLQAGGEAPNEPLGQKRGPGHRRRGAVRRAGSLHEDLAEEDDRRGLGADAHLERVLVAAAAHSGDERLRQVHLDELLGRGRQEADEHGGLRQPFLEERGEAIDVRVDPGERLHDGVVPGREFGEEEHGDPKHLRADGVEEDLHETVHDGGPGERGENGRLGLGATGGGGVTPEALDLEHRPLGLRQVLGRAEAGHGGAELGHGALERGLRDDASGRRRAGAGVGVR